jgi:hypothetical protein
MKINQTLFLLSLILVFSCNREAGVSYVIEPTTNDTIMIEKQEDGSTCWYPIKNSRRNGAFTCFFENGNLKSEGSFSGDKLSDVLFLFRENGSVLIQEEYISGQRAGDRYLFDSLGNISNYQFIDSEELIVFEVLYVGNREFKSNGGLPFFIVTDDSAYQAGEDVNLQAFIGNPRRTLSFELLNCSVYQSETGDRLGALTLKAQEEKTPIRCRSYISNMVFNSPGDYTLAYSVLKTDSSGFDLNVDTLYFNHKIIISPSGSVP